MERRGHTAGCIDYFTMTYGVQPDWYHNNRLVSENGYATDLITDEAVDFLQRTADTASQKPFFLFLAYNGPYGHGGRPARNRHVAYYADKPMDSFPRQPVHPWLRTRRQSS